METADLLLKNDTLVNTLQLRIEEMDRENVLRSPLNTPFSPIPAQNLQPAMTSVAQLDGTIVQTMIDTSLASVYTKNPNRRMTMYGAFGTQSMRSLIIMFPAEPILTTMDDAHSNLYLHGIF